MTKNHNTNFFIIITTIIVVAIIAIAIFAYNYSNVFKKYNTYNLDTKEILSYNEILSGVELITVMNKIDNINRKNKDKVETDKIIEEHEKDKKLFSKNKNKSNSNNSDNENINENDYMKITVKILMPNEKYNPMSLSREEKEKEEENNIKKEEKYITLDMEKILKNGITNFAELFGKSRFKRKNVLYYDNTNNIREIIYIKEGEY